MTQSPYTGQAPRSSDFGTADPARDSENSAWNPHDGGVTGSNGSSVARDPAFGGPVHADAPTGTIPALATGTAVGGADATTTSTPAARSSAGTSTANPQQDAPQRSSQGGKSRSARSRGPRRARLQLRHINPWTVLKFSCVLSIALFFVWLIVVGVLFGILEAAGIIGKINDVLEQINSDGSAFQISPGLVFGSAAIIGVVNIVLFIALSTIGSVVYNLCADLVGGVEVTLSER